MWFFLKTEGETFCFRCDTGLFGDTVLVGAEGFGFAALSARDNFTMGPDDSFRGIATIKPRVVVLVHHNTCETTARGPEESTLLVEAPYDTRGLLLSPGQRIAI